MSSQSAPESPTEIALSYLGSFAGRDPDLIASHVAQDFLNEHTSALGSNSSGRGGYRERLPDFLADMVDLNYEVEHLVVDGNTVAAFYVMTAKWQGGAPIRIRGVQRLVVDHGLIVHRTDYWDSQTFLNQIDE